MRQCIPLLLILCTACFLDQTAQAIRSANCANRDNAICDKSLCQRVDVGLATSICPHVCGYCVPTGVSHMGDLHKVTNVNCSKMDRQGVCVGNFCSTNEVDLQKALCPNLCGHCNKVTNVNCSKGDRQGVCVGNFCSTTDVDLQKALCPNLCGHCISATAVSATSTAPACPNFATNGLRCQDIPNVCSSAYSKVVCPDLCGHCPGGGSPGAAGTAPPPGACVDYVGNGVMCSQLPGVCNDPTSIGPNHFCPRTCNTCGTISQAPTSMTQATTTTATTATTTATTPATTIITTSVAPCVDVGLFGKTCSDLNSTMDVCHDHYGQMACPDFCGLCPCVGPSRNASGDCVDLAEADVCALPGVCSDQVARVFCKHTCSPHLCVHAGCRDHLNQAGATCADQHGAGQPWPTLDDLCKDPLGAKICQATCGCIGFCP